MKQHNDVIDNLITFLRASEGATLWRKVSVNGKDITNNGTRSCAIFVCAALDHIALTTNNPRIRFIDLPSATVIGLVERLQHCGWFPIDVDSHIATAIPVGAIIHWKGSLEDPHDQHIGFFTGDCSGDNREAFSHRASTRSPGFHELHYPGSTIVTIYWHSRLGMFST